MFQVGEGFQVVGLGGFDQGDERGAGLGALWRSREQPVFSSHGKGADGVFRSVVVRLEIAFLQIHVQIFPLVQGVLDRLSQLAFGRRGFFMGLEPDPEPVQDGLGLFVSQIPGPVKIQLQEPGLIFDFVKLPDKIGGLIGKVFCRIFSAPARSEPAGWFRPRSPEARF